MLLQNRDNNSLVIGLKAVRRYRELEFWKIQQSKVNNEISQNNLELNREKFLEFLQNEKLKNEIHFNAESISNKSLSLIWPTVYEMKSMDSGNAVANCEILQSDVRRNLMNDIRMRFMNLEQDEIDNLNDSDLEFSRCLEDYREIWKGLWENFDNKTSEQNNSERSAFDETTKIDPNIRWSISTLDSQAKKTIAKQQNDITQMINDKLAEYRELEENAKEGGDEFEEKEMEKIASETKPKEIPANLIDKKELKKEVKIEDNREKLVEEVVIESGELPDYILPGNSNKSLDYQTKQWIRRHPNCRKL